MSATMARQTKRAVERIRSWRILAARRVLAEGRSSVLPPARARGRPGNGPASLSRRLADTRYDGPFVAGRGPAGPEGYKTFEMTSSIQRRGAGGRDFDFFKLWLRRPSGIGAIVPSGVALARAMAEEIDLATPGLVVELGGGTGNVTAAILNAGLPARDVVVVECEPTLCLTIAGRFPGVEVWQGDARDLGRLRSVLGERQVKCVVSGLPLLSMEPEDCRRIVTGAFELLGEHGTFVQFTYTPVSPIARATRRALGLVAERTDWVLFNVPPATVWRYRRARPGAQLSRAA